MMGKFHKKLQIQFIPISIILKHNVIVKNSNYIHPPQLL